MEAWFATGAAIDLILVLVAIEALGLLWLHRFRGQGPAPGDWLPNLVAGACLMLAVRAALTGQPWPWIAAALLAGLVAHLVDLSRRWNVSSSRRHRPVERHGGVR